MIFGDAITPDGLTITVARAMTLDEWSEAVEMISGLSTASPWWVGDILAYGCLQYGESYAQGIPEDISPATIRGYQWVAERVPPANRHPGLSWSHHRAVSALPPAEQTALLDQAEAEGWSVRELGTRAKGEELVTQEKARVFKVEVEAVTDNNLVLASPAASEIVDTLRAGKRVTLES